jgi:hypothetical protein
LPFLKQLEGDYLEMAVQVERSNKEIEEAKAQMIARVERVKAKNVSS